MLSLALKLGLHPAFAHGWLYNTAAAWKDKNYLMTKVTVEQSTEFYYKGEQPQFVTAKRMKFFNRDYELEDNCTIPNVHLSMYVIKCGSPWI